MGAPKRSPERKRLAKLMDDRRADLRLRWDEVAELAGVTYETLRQVRYGAGEIRILTKRGIEEALQWERGSIDAILAGGDPRPAQKIERETRDETESGADEPPDLPTLPSDPVEALRHMEEMLLRDREEQRQRDEEQQERIRELEQQLAEERRRGRPA